MITKFGGEVVQISLHRDFTGYKKIILVYLISRRKTAYITYGRVKKIIVETLKVIFTKRIV